MLKVGTGFRKTSSARRDAAVAEKPMRCSAALPSLTRGSSKFGGERALGGASNPVACDPDACCLDGLRNACAYGVSLIARTIAWRMISDG